MIIIIIIDHNLVAAAQVSTELRAVEGAQNFIFRVSRRRFR